MEVIFLPRADEDLIYWTDTGNKSVLKKNRKTDRGNFGTPF